MVIPVGGPSWVNDQFPIDKEKRLTHESRALQPFPALAQYQPSSNCSIYSYEVIRIFELRQ